MKTKGIIVVVVVLVLAGLVYWMHQRTPTPAAKPTVSIDQKAIDQLQAQIKKVSDDTHAALSAQQAQTQKALDQLQQNMQKQLAQMQKEIMDMQAPSKT